MLYVHRGKEHKILPTANNDILQLVRKCRQETNLDNQVSMLKELNSRLGSRRVVLNSLITNDYVSRVLDIIEESLAPEKPS